MVQRAFKFHFPQQSQLPPLSNFTAPFLLPFSLCLHMSLYSAASPLRLKVQINRCSSDASTRWNLFRDIYCSSASLSPPFVLSLSLLADRTTGRFSDPSGLTFYFGWHIFGTNTFTCSQPTAIAFHLNSAHIHLLSSLCARAPLPPSKQSASSPCSPTIVDKSIFFSFYSNTCLSCIFLRT